ncbi:hypothetical protein AZE42_07352 [Rhizopogon vesiculosus]|uniref:Ricin B lectin domain-containing protein n=1 Tax=Rhizopogon vesiculosus TaxID=180088 RepID=A0A1J8Q1S3_9AGAM|nr:hypothetical protein AZE42_07352 [Rhizopogon vesiculosus]
MAAFPSPGVYAIRFVKLGCYAAIPQGGNLLEGLYRTMEPVAIRWELKYVDESTDECVCTLTDIDSEDCLGVTSVQNNMPVQRMSPTQEWKLKRTDEGFAIYQVADDITYAWSLSQAGEPVLMSESMPLQSWAFE